VTSAEGQRLKDGNSGMLIVILKCELDSEGKITATGALAVPVFTVMNWR
jgi:hypothetical protein